MYVVDYLKGFPNIKKTEEYIESEFRLISSGALYNGNVITAEWYKSDACRFLYTDPFSLFVCSHPIDEYPQEIALSLRVPLIKEVDSVSSASFHPDEEIASDITSLLTIFTGRYVSVCVKVRQKYLNDYIELPSTMHDWPQAIVTQQKIKYWQKKPATIITTRNKIKEINDNNPSPVAINPFALASFLEKVATSKLNENIIRSAKLYHTAMEWMEIDIDMSYQLLVSSVEVISNVAYQDVIEDINDLKAIKPNVYKRAIEFGLNAEQAENLVEEACKGIVFSKKRFVNFLIKNIPEVFWQENTCDERLQAFIPTQENLSIALKNIYDTRSSVLHNGEAYPFGSAMGTNKPFSIKDFMALVSPQVKFPPIVWFEKVVRQALINFILNYKE